MRKLTILILILCWCASANAMSPTFMGGCGGAGAASCTTANDGKLEYPVTQPGVTAGTSAYNALKIVLSAETTVTTYKIRILDDGANAGSVTAALYNDDGAGATSKPTTAVADSSKNLASSAFSDSPNYTVIDFDLATPLVVSAGTYWIVNYEVDGAARGNPSAVSTGDRVCYSTNGSTWTCADNNAYDMELWGCQ